MVPGPSLSTKTAVSALPFKFFSSPRMACCSLPSSDHAAPCGAHPAPCAGSPFPYVSMAEAPFLSQFAGAHPWPRHWLVPCAALQLRRCELAVNPIRVPGAPLLWLSVLSPSLKHDGTWALHDHMSSLVVVLGSRRHALASFLARVC